MKQKIHIFGASGSGTTSVAGKVCDALGYKHFDSDRYFWLPTEDPFTAERPQDECLQLMRTDLLSCGKWILSGSLTGWGDVFIPCFDLVVFIYVPQDIRLERLKKREYERYGDKMLPGGAKYEHSRAFLEWAAAYDSGTQNGRSLQKHEAWLKMVTCPVLKIVNMNLDDSVNTVIHAIL